MRDFSKYLKDGRRVAAFGEQIGNEVEIFLLYCSKKDQFSKVYAKFTYDLWLSVNKDLQYIKSFKVNPVVFRIPIKEGDSAEYTFKMYMRDNFYKKQTRYYRVRMEKDFLIKDKEVIKTSQKILRDKWS